MCLFIIVEWSCFDDFILLAGEELVEDMRYLEYEIKGLVKGNKYFIRVVVCNMKGYSGYTVVKFVYVVFLSELFFLKYFFLY